MFWKHGKQGRNVNNSAGFLDSNGWRRLTINGVVYQEHVVVWILNTKQSPLGKIIHLNGIKSDNRFENLVLETKIDKRVELSQQRLKELLHYTHETGWFTLKVASKFGSKKVGDVVGYLDRDGYRNITLDSRPYKAHRLAWLYAYGEFPVEIIDHINGNPDDNSIVNLRLADNTQNLHNQKIRSTNTSGFKGVSWNKKRKKWQAQCCLNYVTTHLGYFDSPEEASKAYNDYVKIAHGKFYKDTTK